LRKCSIQKFEDTNRVIRSCIIQYNDQKWPKVLKRKNNYNCIYETYIEESKDFWPFLVIVLYDTASDYPIGIFKLLNGTFPQYRSHLRNVSDKITLKKKITILIDK
jgi:hypothetical protein